MIGNDVVDLTDEETKAGSRHPRFDERVFRAAERNAIRAGSDAHRLRWIYWAAKESAFKLLRRTLPDLAFSPRRFAVRMAGPELATVEASGHVVQVRYECGRDFVHCVAGYYGARATLASVGVLRRTEDASEAVRRLAVESIARCLCIATRDLTVVRDGRLPILLREGRPLPGTLSLSHHGRYVAFAWKSGAVHHKTRTGRSPVNPGAREPVASAAVSPS